MAKSPSPETPGDQPRNKAKKNAPGRTETSGSSSTHDQLIGSKLGEFQILRRLGQGGMAEVFLAEQTSLNRHVALKLLRPELMRSDPENAYLKRFLREAKAAGGLNHPNIVQVYMVGEERGMHYIAQEYVPGSNLSEFIKRKGPLPVAVTLTIMRQVASALQAASEAGIVHRDIKPENILLTKKGEVKVADFGLAQLSLAGEGVNLTQVGITMGTPLYMSPEQVNGKKLDQRSDIYSFGVTCYHMLAGAPPFQGKTALSVAVQHLNDQPPPLQSRRPDVSPQLVELVEKMMAKKREDRPENCQQILSELRRVVATLKGSSEGGELTLSDFDASTGKAAKVASSEKLLGRRWMRSLLAGALLAGISSAGIGWLLRPENPLETPARAENSIPKQESAAAQYLLAANLVNSEAAWKAVGEYFPDALLEKQRAEEQLALLYLREHRLEDARRLFEQFRLQGANNLDVKANGLAGLAVIESYEGNARGSHQKILVDLMELQKQGHRPNPELLALLRVAFEQNRRQLNSEKERTFQELFPEPEPTTEVEIP